MANLLPSVKIHLCRHRDVTELKKHVCKALEVEPPHTARFKELSKLKGWLDEELKQIANKLRLARR